MDNTTSSDALLLSQIRVPEQRGSSSTSSISVSSAFGSPMTTSASSFRDCRQSPKRSRSSNIQSSGARVFMSAAISSIRKPSSSFADVLLGLNCHSLRETRSLVLLEYISFIVVDAHANTWSFELEWQAKACRILSVFWMRFKVHWCFCKDGYSRRATIWSESDIDESNLAEIASRAASALWEISIGTIKRCNPWSRSRAYVCKREPHGAGAAVAEYLPLFYASRCGGVQKNRVENKWLEQ